MVFALLDEEDGKIIKIWHKLNHFTSSIYCNTKSVYYNKRQIAIIDPKILVTFPIIEEGIEGIREYNKAMKIPKRKPSKFVPRDVVPGVI